MPTTLIGPLRKGGAPEVPKHGTLANPELPRNGVPSPPLTTQRPNLFMACHPTPPAVGRLHLRVARGGGRRHWDNHGAVWLGPWGPTARVVHGLEGLAMEIEYLGERFCQVLEEVKAIGNLRRLWRPLSRPVGIGFGPIARDDLDTRVPSGATAQQ